MNSSNIKLILKLSNNLWNYYKPYPKKLKKHGININDITKFFYGDFPSFCEQHQHQQRIYFHLKNQFFENKKLKGIILQWILGIAANF
jgi:hypothetical protein